MHISETLTDNPQRARPPDARADENRSIAVAEEIVNRERSADGCVRTNQNPHLAEPLLVLVEQGLRQAESRNPVAQNTADLVAAVKQRHFVTFSGEHD